MFQIICIVIMIPVFTGIIKDSWELHFSTYCTKPGSKICAICRFLFLCNMHKTFSIFLCILPIDFPQKVWYNGGGARTNQCAPHYYKMNPSKSQDLIPKHSAQKWISRFVQSVQLFSNKFLCIIKLQKLRRTWKMFMNLDLHDLFDILYKAEMVNGLIAIAQFLSIWHS
jgi:hypothetical protein